MGIFVGDGSLYILARKVEQLTDLRVGGRAVVIVCDEFIGNGLLVNAIGVNSAFPGGRGVDAEPTPAPGAGQDGGNGGAGGAGGTVTVMCRHSSGARIEACGGSGAAGGAGGNGGKGNAATSVPSAPTTVVDEDGVEHGVPGEGVPRHGAVRGSGRSGDDPGGRAQAETASRLADRADRQCAGAAGADDV